MRAASRAAPVHPTLRNTADAGSGFGIVYEIRDILYLMCLPYKFAGVVVHTSVGTIAR
jgi:hypothetical protein